MDFVETMKLSLHTQIIFLFTVVFSSSVVSAGDALIGQITRSDLENSAHKIWFNQNYESHVVDIETTKKAEAFLADVSTVSYKTLTLPTTTHVLLSVHPVPLTSQL